MSLVRVRFFSVHSDDNHNHSVVNFSRLWRCKSNRFVTFVLSEPSIRIYHHLQFDFHIQVHVQLQCQGSITELGMAPVGNCSKLSCPCLLFCLDLVGQHSRMACLVLSYLSSILVSRPVVVGVYRHRQAVNVYRSFSQRNVASNIQFLSMARRISFS